MSRRKYQGILDSETSGFDSWNTNSYVTNLIVY